jgi:hypothetical protein
MINDDVQQFVGLVVALNLEQLTFGETERTEDIREKIDALWSDLPPEVRERGRYLSATLQGSCTGVPYLYSRFARRA